MRVASSQVGPKEALGLGIDFGGNSLTALRNLESINRMFCIADRTDLVQVLPRECGRL